MPGEKTRQPTLAKIVAALYLLPPFGFAVAESVLFGFPSLAIHK